MASLLSTLSIVSFIFSGVFALLAVVFGFVFKIPAVIGDLSGRTAKKTVERMRLENEREKAKTNDGAKKSKTEKLNVDKYMRPLDSKDKSGDLENLRNLKEDKKYKKNKRIKNNENYKNYKVEDDFETGLLSENMEGSRGYINNPDEETAILGSSYVSENEETAILGSAYVSENEETAILGNSYDSEDEETGILRDAMDIDGKEIDSKQNTTTIKIQIIDEIKLIHTNETI